MRAVANKVIIQRETQEERKIGSIILSGNYWAEHENGTVLAVGPDCTTVKKGDRVHYARPLGRQIPVGNGNWDVQLEKDIVFVYDPDDATPTIS